MFKVVPDQLRISDGWVRCGHCAEVFDASANMQADPPAALTAVVPAGTGAQALAPQGAPTSLNSAHASELLAERAVPVVLDEPRSTAAAVATVPVASAAIATVNGPAFAPAAAPVTAPVSAPVAAPPAVPVTPPSIPVTPPAARAPTVSDSGFLEGSDVNRRRYDFPEDESAGYSLPIPDSLSPASQPPVLSRDANGRDSSLLFDDEPASQVPDSTLENVSFVREARRKAFWRRPLVRLALSLVVLVLLGALGLQVAVQERDRIAAREPRARPLLEQLCAQVGCTVQPLRQIESIVIDASSFTKLRTDSYRLSFTVKNTNANLPLAMPAFELALTDSSDQAVVRRVLLPADLGAPSAVLAPGGEWSGNLPLGISGGSRVVGYRLLAFYP